MCYRVKTPHCNQQSVQCMSASFKHQAGPEKTRNQTASVLAFDPFFSFEKFFYAMKVLLCNSLKTEGLFLPFSCSVLCQLGYSNADQKRSTHNQTTENQTKASQRKLETLQLNKHLLKPLQEAPINYLNCEHPIPKEDLIKNTKQHKKTQLQAETRYHRKSSNSSCNSSQTKYSYYTIYHSSKATIHTTENKPQQSRFRKGQPGSHCLPFWR